MAAQLYFRNQLYGDCVAKFESNHSSQSPPAILVGLLQPAAAIDSMHGNRLWSLTFTVKLRRSTQLGLLDAVAAIQEMQNERGIVLYKENGTTKIRCTDWVLISAPQPRLREAFGGTLVEDWALQFSGSTRPERF